jgi:hypothetical protein
MAGIMLREKHKPQHVEQVLDAAQSLFDASGYTATKIAEIAKRASVVPERRRFLARLPFGPIDDICAFEWLLADQALRHLSRDCWRALLAAQCLEPQGPAHRTGLRLNLPALADPRRSLRLPVTPPAKASSA